ncbi:hypothetical protein SDC9_169503 [bioreactor metagenome]|uniref:Uncharacterized protein n=1 Tax=bioreactor metagenome TaxID=1076179 RepID=A0A645G805_9ZZZZ
MLVVRFERPRIDVLFQHPDIEVAQQGTAHVCRDDLVGPELIGKPSGAFFVLQRLKIFEIDLQQGLGVLWVRFCFYVLLQRIKFAVKAIHLRD